MMKMAITVNELIERLTEIENKELEVWIKGSDGIICPCSLAKVDKAKECVVLGEDRPFADETFTHILKSMRTQ